MERIFECVRTGVGADPRVRIVRRPSLEAVAEVGFLDWVYVDGNHTFAAVQADLEAFAGRLRPGGLLCGDDYGLAG